mgnify:CR=1 FL=1
MAKLLKAMGTIYLIGSILLAGIYIHNCTEMFETLDVWNIGLAIGIVFQGLFVCCLSVCVSFITDKCEFMSHKLDEIDKNVFIIKTSASHSNK